jgi:hypothetical protein
MREIHDETNLCAAVVPSFRYGTVWTRVDDRLYLPYYRTVSLNLKLAKTKQLENPEDGAS